jgi:dienelactone hydrolase
MAPMLICAILALACLLLPGCTYPRPPEQPRSGFGGADYITAQVRKQYVERNGTSFFVFEPVASEAPLSRPAPLVIFFPGWECNNPASYGGWLDHLARRGCVVVWVEYQSTKMTATRHFMANAMESAHEAVAWLRERKDLSVDLDHPVVFGHSTGGMLAANYAVVAKFSGAPIPKAVFAVHPGTKWVRLSDKYISLENMAELPPEALLVVLQGDGDWMAMQRDGREIIANATNTPREKKRLIILRADSHGRPKIESGHFACFAQDNAYDADAIKKGTEVAAADRKTEIGPQDYLVYWRILDALIAAPPGCSLNEALGNEPTALDMGSWSDWTPVRHLEER